MDNNSTEKRTPTLMEKYFDSSDALCKFVNDEQESGKIINIVSIIALGSGSAYRLFYEIY